MPRIQKHLVQIQLSEEERRWIKTLATRRGMTLKQAVLAAFAVWEAAGAKPATAKAPADNAKQKFVDQTRRLAAELAQPRRGPADQAAAEAVAKWLDRALKLHWAKCPEVERGPDRVWKLKGAKVPLWNVLQALSGGNPLPEIAEVYEVPVKQVEAIAGFVRKQ